MSLQRSRIVSLAIAVMFGFVVSPATAQPDPFQPLKPKETPVKLVPRVVSSSESVSLVAESKTASEQRAQISAALNGETAIDFQVAPLSDVVSFLHDLHGIPIVLDLRAMDDVGIGSDAPVTVNLRGISLRSALRLMLRELDLTYLVADGVLQITTPESAESRLLQHVYPVDDLAAPSSKGPNRLSELSELVMQTIASDSWAEQGGPGVIVPIDHLGVLVVSQTTDVHEQIGDLIVTLRRVREMQPK